MTLGGQLALSAAVCWSLFMFSNVALAPPPLEPKPLRSQAGASSFEIPGAYPSASYGVSWRPWEGLLPSSKSAVAKIARY